MTDDLDDFRSQTRQWLEENCPPEMRHPVRHEGEICHGGRDFVFISRAQQDWLRAMASRGWTTPTWPVRYGGGGLSPQQAEILQEELKRIDARPPIDPGSIGISMLGPALLAFGSEAQKRQHIPPVAKGEIRWCQGYSEPNAGSDLAAVGTRGEDAGDSIIVNGQKIWTSYGHLSDWMFCLVRTDQAAPKHKGISFVLFDMNSPGITTRPIRLISGESSFCETFFDNLAVAKENLVGNPGDGWTIAKYLLTHERENIASKTGKAAIDLAALAREHFGGIAGATVPPALQDRIVQIESDEAALALMIEDVQRHAAASGDPIGATSSVIKYYGTELNKRRQEVVMDLVGLDGLEWRGATISDDNFPQAWLRSKANTIEGGTSEIMLNIIAKAILKLPEAKLA